MVPREGWKSPKSCHVCLAACVILAPATTPSRHAGELVCKSWHSTMAQGDWGTLQLSVMSYCSSKNQCSSCKRTVDFSREDVETVSCFNFSQTLASFGCHSGSPLNSWMVTVVKGGKCFSGQDRKTLRSCAGLCHFHQETPAASGFFPEAA